MALTICKECGKEISEHATVCPHCGYPLLKDGSADTNRSTESASSSSFSHTERSKRKKLPIIILSAILVIVAIIAFILIKNAKEKAAAEVAESIAASESAAESSRLEEERIKAYNDYIDNLKTVRFTMLSGAAEAESVCNLTKSVWYNTIYEKSDSKTDKYTKNGVGFNSDFNTSLRKLYDSEEIKTSISTLQDNQSDVEELIKLLQSPPDELNECYKTVMEMYSVYNSFVQLAISPSGSLQTYSENFNSYDSNLMTLYDKLGVQIPSAQ